MWNYFYTVFYIYTMEKIKYVKNFFPVDGDAYDIIHVQVDFTVAV